MLGKPDTKRQPFWVISVQHTHIITAKTDENNGEYLPLAADRQAITQQRRSHKTPWAYESRLGKAGCQFTHKRARSHQIKPSIGLTHRGLCLSTMGIGYTPLNTRGAFLMSLVFPLQCWQGPRKTFTAPCIFPQISGAEQWMLVH